MDFSIITEEKENIVVITVKGDVDMFTSPNLRDEITPFFDREVKGIIVDLSAVSFMDSSGIATLVEGLQWSRSDGREFVLTGLGANVRNALSLTKLEDVFTIYPEKKRAYEKLLRR